MWCQIEAVLNILTFSKWPPFWGPTNFFTRSDTGSWMFQQHSHEHFRQFDRCSSLIIHRDMSVQNFGLFMDQMTSPMTSWIRIYISVVKIKWCKWTPSLMMSLYVFGYYNKRSYFICKECRGSTLRSPCDVLDDVINMKIAFFSGIIWDNLFISDIKLNTCIILWRFQNGRYFELFHRMWYRKSNIPAR